MTRTIYLVAVGKYEVYHQSFEATSREDALSQAEANWEERGAQDWSFKVSGTIGFQIADEREAVA